MGEDEASVINVNPNDDTILEASCPDGKTNLHSREQSHQSQVLQSYLRKNTSFSELTLPKEEVS